MLEEITSGVDCRKHQDIDENAHANEVERRGQKRDHQKGTLPRLVAQKRDGKPGPGETADELEKMKVSFRSATSVPPRRLLVTGETDEGQETENCVPPSQTEEDRLIGNLKCQKGVHHQVNRSLPWES
jgi:hypothetical protein